MSRPARQRRRRSQSPTAAGTATAALKAILAVMVDWGKGRYEQTAAELEPVAEAVVARGTGRG